PPVEGSRIGHRLDAHGTAQVPAHLASSSGPGHHGLPGKVPNHGVGSTGRDAQQSHGAQKLPAVEVASAEVLLQLRYRGVQCTCRTPAHTVYSLPRDNAPLWGATPLSR